MVLRVVEILDLIQVNETNKKIVEIDILIYMNRVVEVREIEEINVNLNV